MSDDKHGKGRDEDFKYSGGYSEEQKKKADEILKDKGDLELE